MSVGPRSDDVGDVVVKSEKMGLGKTSANPLLARIKTLIRRGHLVLMDDTHNTNKLMWKLFTLMARDEWGKWIPCANMLSSHNDGDIVGAFLKQVKIWCGGDKTTGRDPSWKLRYIITDDSASEQKAVRIAFRGLDDGEGVVDHYLCQKHSERTLKGELAGDRCKTARTSLYSALYFRQSRPGCEEEIQKALSTAPDNKKDYIWKKWWKTRSQWAYFARQHSCLLLQAMTTNAVESWHKSIKHRAGGKKKIRSFSLQGIASHVCYIADQWELDSMRREARFRTTKVRECKIYPNLALLPGPVQQLIVEQIKRGGQMIADGMHVSLGNP